MEERSAGAVVFNPRKGRRYVLLLNRGRWDFPKGNIEEGENEVQTVQREVGEETGLKEIVIVPGFRKVVEYFYRRGGRNVHKRVVYLLASTESERVKISTEHQGFGWFKYEEAVRKATYDNSKDTLREAESFLQSAASPRTGAPRS